MIKEKPEEALQWMAFAVVVCICLLICDETWGNLGIHMKCLINNILNNCLRYMLCIG